MRLEEGGTTLEQSLQLRLLADELRGYSRGDLEEALIEERRIRLVERQWFRVVMEQAGVATSLEQEEGPSLPETPGELSETLGRPLEDGEFEAFINERMEAARLDDIDIEAIALGRED